MPVLCGFLGWDFADPFSMAGWIDPPRATAKKALAANQGQVNKDLGEELKLPDSRAAGRQCFPCVILA